MDSSRVKRQIFILSPFVFYIFSTQVPYNSKTPIATVSGAYKEKIVDFIHIYVYYI